MMYKAKELKNQSIEELRATCAESRKQLFDLRGRQRSRKDGAKHHEIKHVRKNIARLLTVIGEKEK